MLTARQDGFIVNLRLNLTFPLTVDSDRVARVAGGTRVRGAGKVADFLDATIFPFISSQSSVLKSTSEPCGISEDWTSVDLTLSDLLVRPNGREKDFKCAFKFKSTMFARSVCLYSLYKLAVHNFHKNKTKSFRHEMVSLHPPTIIIIVIYFSSFWGPNLGPCVKYASGSSHVTVLKHCGSWWIVLYIQSINK